jgi:hypothetical protein
VEPAGSLPIGGRCHPGRSGLTLWTLYEPVNRTLTFCARVTSRYVMLASLGECLLVLWLSVKGVDEKRWHEQATAAAQW